MAKAHKSSRKQTLDGKRGLSVKIPNETYSELRRYADSQKRNIRQTVEIFIEAGLGINQECAK